MSDQTQQDVRRLLKTFGIQADEAIMAHISQYPGEVPLQLRLILEDVTDYGDAPPDKKLYLEIEGTVGR
jgi:hypothetical protein